MYEWGRKMRKRPLPAVLASAFLLGTATITLALGQVSAQTKYAVDGVAVGSRVKSDSATYLEYKCSPSDQFDGFTWCQKTRNDRDRRRASTATYSILHAQDGNIVYVNRFQVPSHFDRNEADKEIQAYSDKLGEPAHVTRMPHRAGLPDGIMALWGKTTLEPLDHDSTKILAGGKSPKKGLLIDFIGNFARSAQDGLPIYRIGGGPGLLWVTSFDQKNRGTVRFAAVDASGLSPPVPEQVRGVSLATAQGNPFAANFSGLEQTTQTDKSPTSEDNITHLDSIGEDAAATDQLLAGKVVSNTKSHTLEVLAYGAIIGGLVCLTLVAQLRWLRRRAKGLNQLSEAAILPVQIQTRSPESSERSVSEYCAPQLTKNDCEECDIAPEQEPNGAEKLDVRQPFSLSDLSLAVHGELRQTPEIAAA
jgi:hypothetical protein